jgi:predicted acylesterase/phospholipase RssA
MPLPLQSSQPDPARRPGPECSTAGAAAVDVDVGWTAVEPNQHGRPFGSSGERGGPATIQREDEVAGAGMTADTTGSGTVPRRDAARPYILVAAGLTALWLAGCSLPERRSAVPKGQELAATVDSMEDVRYWPPEDLGTMQADAVASVDRERAALLASGSDGPLPPANFLAISGGGEDGAFGAGLLVGWTAAGTRPEFKLVTGVSTGALTAPFAFLGPDYDDELTAVYTSITAADVLRVRGVLAALDDDAMADNAPLRRTIARYLTEDVLKAIAREHAKGRILLIGTTNLDARRPIIWNVGKIAESGRPGALELVQDILIASAAVPGAFPPTMIDVMVNGQPHQEMHVDGGASAQVFVYPPSLDLDELAKAQGIVRERNLYVIRNARLDPEWAEVKRSTLNIAGRAISALIQGQGVGDLYRIYTISQRDRVNFHLAYIPPTFDVPLTQPFEQAYMRALYDVGYRAAAAGYPWRATPPGY